MKSSTVWHGHSTRLSLPAGTARKASGSLLHGRRNRLIMQTTKNRKFPLGTPCCTYRYRLWLLAGCVRVDAPCFILTLISVSSFFIVTFVHLSFPYVLQCICLSQQCPFGAFLYLHTDRFFYMYPL